jgi:hypothetical protein
MKEWIEGMVGGTYIAAVVAAAVVVVVAVRR